MSKNISNKNQEQYNLNNPRKNSDSINYFFDSVFDQFKEEVEILLYNPYTNFTFEQKKEVRFCLERSLCQLYVSTEYYKHHLSMLWIEFEDAVKSRT